MHKVLILRIAHGLGLCALRCARPRARARAYDLKVVRWFVVLERKLLSEESEDSVY